MKGAPMSSTVEKMAATASARRNAWKTRASARSRRPAPSARATADETPAPMPLLVVCSTIITQGNASEAPASALVPMRPRKNPSNVITPANASRVRTFGAARRSSVGRIGPSSSSLVRAAVDAVTPLAGANDGGEIETFPLFIGNSCPIGGLAQRFNRASREPGDCVRRRQAQAKRMRLKTVLQNSRLDGRGPLAPCEDVRAHLHASLRLRRAEGLVHQPPMPLG